MSYVIEARYIAEKFNGLVTRKGEVLVFKDEDQARKFGKAYIENTKYIASWEAITKTEARQRGHSIN